MPATKKPAKKPTKKPARKFRKLVLAPGRYPVGKDKYEEFDSTRLRKLADAGNKFIGTGAKIPVPFAHVDDSGELVSPVNISQGGGLKDAFSGQPIGWRADLNAGFVESFEYGTVEDEDGQSYEGLISVMEIEADSADKFGTSIREASIGIHADKEDKFGNRYEELPIHVAACINPVDTVQPNYQAVELFSSSVLLFNTSEPKEKMDFDTDDTDDQAKPKNPLLPEDPQTAPGQDQMLAHVVEALQQCGIHLPEDTTEENFLERLSLVIKQKIATDSASSAEEDEDPLTKTPKGSTPSGAPVAMNTTSPESKSDSKAEKYATLLLSNFLATKRETVKERIANLIKRGRITQKYAESDLLPQVKTITLSSTTLEDLTDEGDLPPTEVERLIDALEKSAGEDLTKPNEDSKTPDGKLAEPPVDSELGYWGYQDADESDTKQQLELSKSIPVIC